MNYNAENRTPRDRVGEALFSQIKDLPTQRYGIQKNTLSSAARPAAAMAGQSNPTQMFCPINRSKARAQHRNSACGGVQGEDKLAGLPLAMAYVPMQEWKNLYDLETGFGQGTLFEDLDFPFYPTSCPRKGCR